MLVKVHSLSLLTAIVASGDLASAIPFEASSSTLAARDMPRPRFGNVPYGVDLTHCTVKGKVALSFDDGPGEYTEKVLDTLEKNGNIKATFFLVGTNGNNGISNAAYTPVLKRMFNAGHQLASHSWSHKDFNTISHDQKVEELVKNEEAFAKVLGIVPTYFRPPYTHCDSACISTLNDLSYHVTDYNLDTKDWVDQGANSKQTFASAIGSSNPASDSFIALSHDIQPFTVNGFVQYMIDVAKEKGYSFTTIGDCLGDPASNWYRDPKTGEAWSGAKDDTKPSISKPAFPSSTSASSTSSAESKTSATATGTESQSAKPSATKTATENDNEPENVTKGPGNSTAVRPPVASATLDGGANVGLNPATPTGSGPASPTRTAVEVNAAGRAAFPVAGALAGVLVWALMI